MRYPTLKLWALLRHPFGMRTKNWRHLCRRFGGLLLQQFGSPCWFGSLLALNFPGGVDDLFLQFGKFRESVSLAAGVGLLLIAALALAFAEDFLERPHLGE